MSAMTAMSAMSAMSAMTLQAQGSRGTPAKSLAISRPSTVETLRQVDQLVARNDSLGALSLLDSAIARDRSSGPLWHAYGRIAWGMSKTEKSKTIMRPQMIGLRMRADSAMRFATVFSPDSAQYWLDLGRYALETDNVFIRAGARREFARGVEQAKAQGAPAVASRAVEQLAMFDWREYDDDNHRAMQKQADAVNLTGKLVDQSISQTLNCPMSRLTACEPTTSGDFGAAVVALPTSLNRNRWDEYYIDALALVKPITGEAAFVKALNGFRDALRLDSTNARARRHVYGALADHSSWHDLKQEADRALRANNDDTDAWLARGVALTSLEDYENAASAFDNGLRRLSATDRGSFTDIKRIMAPSSMTKTAHLSDSLHWEGLSATERQRQATLFWNLADPRASTRVNEAMVEFFARVAYADLRFGSDEYRLRGANTDRGDTWVRYGPPDEMYSIRNAGTEIIWIYRKLKLTFVFDMAPTFGTAYVPFSDRVSVDSIHGEHPQGWDNIAWAHATWPMRTRIARFRASADSMDAVITATVPVRSFLGDAELGGKLPIFVQLDVNDPHAKIVGREVRQIAVTSDSLPVGINGAWVRRLGRGDNIVRVDAEQPDVRRAATGISETSIDTTSGFGMSDLLLGTNPTSASTTAPARWRDVSVAPTTGVFPWAQSIGVVWEAYDLTPQDGSVRYKVNVRLSRTFAMNLAGFVARIAAFGKNVLERDGSSTGTVNVGYEQSRPASPTITDFLSINMKGSVPGNYTLEIEIEDRVSKRVTRRSTELVLTRD